MSPEICPFCGKSFKRLKSHVPHCKAAAKFDGRDEAEKAAKAEKSAPKLTLKTNGVKREVERAAPSKTSKKTTPKVSGKLEIGAKTSPPAPAESPLISKSQTKNHKSRRNHEQLVSIEMTRSVSADLERTSLSPVEKKASKTAVEKKSLDDSRNADRTTAAKKKDAKTAKSALNHETDHLKRNSRTEDENGVKGLSEIDPWNKRETRITLEDVRTTLKRAKHGDSKKDNLVDKIVSDGIKWDSLARNKAENTLVKVQQERAAKLTVSGSRRSEITWKSDDFLSRLSQIENQDCSFTLGSETLGEGLRMDRHSSGSAAVLSPAHTLLEAEVLTGAFRKDLAPFLEPNRAKNATEETTSGAKGRDGGRCARDALAQRRLGQVTLRELPDWLVLKSPRRPGDVMDAAQRGWQWYYRRYIDVKRGGLGGVAMLLAGYCVLSYVWTFPHLKRDRWRKYH
ncbi:uncharacterized protein [Eucyclogobius newberryi]|uniref:uncharacterized protein n=1 Tax=Eucyclogobius newberryi TaxID=166745 RepID=UPI003B5B3A5D